MTTPNEQDALVTLINQDLLVGTALYTAAEHLETISLSNYVEDADQWLDDILSDI